MLKENLKKVRQELGLSVAKLSQKIEIPAPTLTCYERGERTPSAQLFIQLHIKLNVNLNWFVTGKGEMFSYDTNRERISKEEILSDVRKMLINEGLLK